MFGIASNHLDYDVIIAVNEIVKDFFYSMCGELDHCEL